MIKRIKVENWKSHLRSELGFEKGVNALIGEMGSGKSSILEAISFALYGTTPLVNSRTVKLENLIRRYPQKCDKAVVEIDFMFNENLYTVKRILKRNGSEAEIRKNGKLLEGPSSSKVTELVSEILKMDFDLFSRAIYSEQNNLDYFLNLRPSERKKKIDELLKFEDFEKVRKNSVTLLNRIKSVIKEKERDLKNFDVEKLNKELKGVKDEINLIEIRLIENREKKNDVEMKLRDAENNYKNLLEKKREFENLNEEIKRISGRIESLKSILEREKEIYDEEELNEKILKVENRLNELKNIKIRRDEMKRDFEVINLRIRMVEEEVKKLEEESKRFERYHEVEEKYNNLKLDVEKIRFEITSSSVKLNSLRNEVELLNSSEGRCPVCNEILKEERKKILISEKEEEIDKLEKEIDKLKLSLNKKEEDLRGIEDLREELLKFRDSSFKLNERLKERDDLKRKLEEMENELSEIDSKFNEEEMEKLERERIRIEELKKLIKLKYEKEGLEKKFSLMEKRIREIEFSQDEFERIKEKIFSLKNEINVISKEIENLDSLKREKERIGEMIEKEIERYNNIKREISDYEKIAKFLKRFADFLQKLQIQLRNEFNESLNYLMNEIWRDLYPYDDYQEIRIRGGEDYILEIMDREGNWIPIEGQVSGGERQTSALVLRIALSILLSPSLRILILDEPTHNLDSKAIDILSENLKNKVSGYFDQLFLITHEDRLENCVTGTLYRFSKKETKSGLTEIERVELNN